ncbi:hypothetical protein K491DRAFT_685873 [Lophiostoma macrostomum CBS 122681]|uniref:Uncharacterized protein n=1 Tax=Lophiostoma macrostomum CBS 122681 TaxID=1314788 RepID=A0A6A6SGT6_9PLEO|nr:hypothetical protein K491DRAFT_685873 [Lophiostoma macrostomum CBS 122681]
MPRSVLRKLALYNLTWTDNPSVSTHMRLISARNTRGLTADLTRGVAATLRPLRRHFVLYGGTSSSTEAPRPLRRHFALYRGTTETVKHYAWSKNLLQYCDGLGNVKLRPSLSYSLSSDEGSLYRPPASKGLLWRTSLLMEPVRYGYGKYPASLQAVQVVVTYGKNKYLSDAICYATSLRAARASSLRRYNSAISARLQNPYATAMGSLQS